MHCRTQAARAPRLATLAATLLTATALSAFGASPTLAQTASWAGGVSDDWFTVGNWLGAPPDNTRDVVINGPTTAVIAGGGSGSTGNLSIGDGAEGALRIEDGELNAYIAAIGKAGGTGKLSVVGSAASFESQLAISLGQGGTGELEILEGGTVGSQQGVIGADADSEGIVTIDGAGSNWSTWLEGAGMLVGYFGKGTVTVQNGGSVNTNGTWIGYAYGSEGALTVTGTDSRYIDEGDMYVGGLGGGTGTLDVNDGAYVEIFNSLYVGYGGKGTATVDGTDTQLLAHGGVVITDNGTFTVSDGASVQSGGGYIDASSAAEDAASATVTGAGSSWVMDSQLMIGLEGKGSLLVTDGGTVETTQISLGSRAGANGTLTISEGGQVVTDYVMMAEEAGSTASLRLESGGQLSAQQVQRYDGAGTVAFDGGTLKLTADQYFGLFAGFQTGDVTLEAGGGTIDTGTYAVYMDIGLVGEGGFTKQGAGTLHLYGASTYEGPTLIGAGTLRARESGVLSATSAYEVAAGATLRIDNNKTQTIGSLAGAGTVQLGNPPTTNAPAGGSAQLTLGGNDASTNFSGVLAGKGQLIKTGTGTLTLSGVNTFTGATTVSGGGLNVLGTLLSNVTAESGTRLGGTGTYGAISVGDGAVLAPGTSIGALTTGALTLNAGSIYEIELSDGGNTAGVHNDITHVTGTATIEAGTTIRVLAGNGTDTGRTYTPGLVYTIIDTTAPGDLTVAAPPEIIDNFAYLNFTGSHDGQNFYLTSSLEAVSFCLEGSTANQCAAGDALFALGAGNAGFDLFQGLSEADAPAALDAISGEAHASMQQVLEQSFAALGQTVNRRTAAGLAGAGAAAGPLGYAAAPGNSGVGAIDDATMGGATPGTARPWIGALGSYGKLNGDGNAAAIEWSTGGLALGYENEVNLGGGTGFGGVALGYQHGQGIVTARYSETAFDSLSAAAYGGWSDGATTLVGALSVGTAHVATDRTIAVGGSSTVANADYWAQSANLQLEASHAFELGGGLSLAPLGTLSVGWLGRPGFTETGADAFNLTAEARDDVSAAAGLGLAVGQQVALEAGTLALEARALYEASLTDANTTEAFSFAGGTGPFSISGAPADANWVRLGAGFAFELPNGLSLGANYDGRLSANGQSQQASASLGGSF